MLELGGSDPFVVLDDADLVAAADAAVKSRFGNGGQSCIAAKRFIVAESVADEFVSLFVERVGALQVGDPTDPATTVGPMARDDLRDGLQRQVAASVAEGAELVSGGQPIDAPGYYFEPTVLDHVVPGMTAFVEETFGPVAVDRPGPRRRPRRRARQRHRLRPGRFGLGGLGARPGRGSADPLGRAVRQRDGRLRPAAAVRRHRPLRLRPRAVGRGHPRVHQRPDVFVDEQCV